MSQLQPTIIELPDDGPQLVAVPGVTARRRALPERESRVHPCRGKARASLRGPREPSGTAVDDRAHRVWDRAMKSYENLRWVIEIQSRLKEWSEEDQEAQKQQSLKSGTSLQPVQKDLKKDQNELH